MTLRNEKKRKAAPNTDSAAAKTPKRKSGKARDAKYLQQASSAVALEPGSEEYSAACDAFARAGLKALGSKAVLTKFLESISRPLPGATQEVLAKRAERPCASSRCGASSRCRLTMPGVGCRGAGRVCGRAGCVYGRAAWQW